MIDRILDLLRGEEQQDDAIAVELAAAAALLFEVVWADHNIDHTELQAMSGALVQQFNLSPGRVAEILEQTRSHHASSVGVFAFTRALNEQLDQQQKLAVISAMWQVAFADNKLDAFEEHTVRRVAELLYVSHKDFIAAKIAARNNA